MIASALPPAILVPLALLLVLARRRWAAVVTLALFLLMATESYAVWLLAVLDRDRPVWNPPGGESSSHTAPAAAATWKATAVMIFSPPGPTPTTSVQPWLPEARTGAALARRTGLPVLVAGAAAPAIAASLMQEFDVAPRWVVQGKDPSRMIAGSVSALRSSQIRSVYLVTTVWEWGAVTARLQRADIVAVPPNLPSAIKRRGNLLDWVPVASTLMDSADGARALLERARAHWGW